MSKICLTCKKEVNDASVFCDYCGSTQFICKSPAKSSSGAGPKEPTGGPAIYQSPGSPISNTNINEAPAPFQVQQNHNQNFSQPIQYGYYNPGTNPGNSNGSFYSSTQSNKPRRSSKGIVIGILIAVFCVIVLPAILISVINKNRSTKNNDYTDRYTEQQATSESYNDYDETEYENSDSTTAYTTQTSSTYSKPDTPYSKGTFEGNIYINKWAGIMVEMPDEMQKKEHDFTQVPGMLDSGFYYVSDFSLKSIDCIFASSSVFESDEEIQEMFNSIFINAANNTLEEKGLNTKVRAEEPVTIQIAGKVYNCVNAVLAVYSDEELVKTMYYSYAYRIYDSHYIIFTTETTDNSNNELFDIIKPYN